MLDLLLILFYTTLLSLFILKSKFIKLQNVSKLALLSFFYLKLLAAFGYLFIMSNLITAGDIFNYYNDSLIVFDYLKNGDIKTYLTLTFGINNTEISHSIAQAVHEMGFWFDTSSYIQVRLNALFNIFTWGQSIYANAIFFAFFSFIAGVLFIKILQDFLQHKSKGLSYMVFLLPSALFWTSGMHKEAFSVFLAALVLWSFFLFIKHKQLKYVLLFVSAFFMLFFLRYFIAALLAVPLFAFMFFALHQKFKPIIYFATTYFFAAIALYFVPLIFNKPNIIDLINNKKELYLALKQGNTAIDLGNYELSYLGYLAKVPQALTNTLARPFFTEAPTLFLKLASIESFFVTVLVLSSFFFIHKLKAFHQALVYVFYAFSISYLILAGLIVPNIGAILRYRSVALFFLIPACAFVLQKAFFLRKK